MPAAKHEKYVEFCRPHDSNRRMTKIPNEVTRAAKLLAKKAVKK